MISIIFAIQNEKSEMVKFLLYNGVKFEETKSIWMNSGDWFII